MSDFFENELKNQIKDIVADNSLSESQAFVFWICKKLLDIHDEDIEEKMEITSLDLPVSFVDIDADEEIVTIGHVVYDDTGQFEIRENHLQTFMNVVLDLKEFNYRGNQKFKDISTEICNALSNNYRIKTIFVTTGRKTDEANNFSKLNWELVKNYDLQILDIDDLKYIVKDEPTPEVTISFEPGEMFEKTDLVQGKIGIVKASEIVRIYEKNKHRLFTLNPRESLKKTTINKEILSTLEDSEKRKNFWMYNNGINAICKDWHELENEIKFEFKNFKIVNGRQTTGVLYEATNNGWIDDSVQLLLRVSKITNEEEREEISKATNTQNAIRWSDIVSSRKEQKQLYQEIKRDYSSFYYEFQRGGYDNLSKDEKESIIKHGVLEKEKVARNYIAFHQLKPYSAVSKSQEFIFRDMYDGIFGSLTPKDAIVPHVFDKIFDLVKNEWKKDAKDDLEMNIARIRIGKYYTLSLINQVLTDLSNKAAIHGKIIELFHNKDHDALKTIIQTAINQLGLSIESLYEKSEDIPEGTVGIKKLLAKDDMFARILSGKTRLLSISGQADPLVTEISNLI